MATTSVAPGNVRYTVETTVSTRDEIAALAKHYRITQGEVVDCLLIAANAHGATEADKVMSQASERKKSARKAKREADSLLKAAIEKMPAAQRARLLGEAP